MRRPGLGLARPLSPPYAAVLNSSHPLARDLLYFIVMPRPQQPVDLVTGRTWAPTIGGPISFGESGNDRGDRGAHPMTYISNAGNNVVPLGRAWQPTLPLTMAVGGEGYNSGTFRGYLCTCMNATTWYGAYMAQSGDLNRTIQVGYGDGTGATSASYRRYVAGATATLVGKVCTISASLRGPTDMDIFIEGRKQTSNAAFSGTGGAIAYDSSSQGRLWHGPAGINGYSGKMSWAALWARNLEDHEHMRLFIDPFEMFSVAG